MSTCFQPCNVAGHGSVRSVSRTPIKLQRMMAIISLLTVIINTGSAALLLLTPFPCHQNSHTHSSLLTPYLSWPIYTSG